MAELLEAGFGKLSYGGREISFLQGMQDCAPKFPQQCQKARQFRAEIEKRGKGELWSGIAEGTSLIGR
jgi:hypothetical protein